MFEQDVIQRTSLRVLMPVGTSKKRPGDASINRTSELLRRALMTFENWGWIKRREVAIEVLDRPALLQFVTGSLTEQRAARLVYEVLTRIAQQYPSKESNPTWQALERMVESLV